MRARARDRARVRFHGAACACARYWIREGVRGACGGVRAYINARGRASGREGAQEGGAVSHGRSQRRLDGPGRGLRLAAGAIPPPWPLVASQTLSGALSSEQGRAVAITHKSPPPREGQGAGGRVAGVAAS